MFVVLLRFSDKKGQAGQFMEGHNAWLRRGFEEGVFLLAGGLQPNSGGGILAHNTSLPDLQEPGERRPVRRGERGRRGNSRDHAIPGRRTAAFRSRMKRLDT